MPTTRNPSFKPTDDPQVVTLVGPIINQQGRPVTWEDTQNPNFIKTFHLYTVADAGGAEMTWFARDYVHEMVKANVPNGQDFSVWKYGRKGTSGKFFGDIAIGINGNEFFAGDWDNPRVKSQSASSGNKGQQPNAQPTATQPAPAQSAPTQASPKGNPDDIGMSVECFTYAARVLLSTPVRAASDKLGLAPTFEDLRSLAISFMIDRRHNKEIAPRNPTYAYENLTFTPPDASTPPAEEPPVGPGDSPSPEDNDGIPF